MCSNLINLNFLMLSCASKKYKNAPLMFQSYMFDQIIVCLGPAEQVRSNIDAVYNLSKNCYV
jgi:hypothetical protein